MSNHYMPVPGTELILDFRKLQGNVWIHEGENEGTEESKGEVGRKERQM